MKKAIAIIVLGLFLSGCAGGNPLATPYKPRGMSGGYSEQQVATDRYLVKFSGNGYISRSGVHNRAMLRAAEFTIEKGKDLFAIIHDDEQQKEGGSYTTTIEIKMFNFTDYIIDETNLTKTEYKNRFEDFISSEALTNYYIAEDTVTYIDKYRY